MTETEWRACTDPKAMLEELYFRVRARRLRLFACACCRRIWHRITNEPSRKAVEVAEQYADESATDTELSLVRDAAFEAERAIQRGEYGKPDPAAELAASAASYVTGPDEDFHSSPQGDEFTATWGAAYCAAESIVHEVERVPRRAAWRQLQEQAREAEQVAQCNLLRDIIRPPSLPVAIDLAWLVRNGGTVKKLAQTIYNDQRLEDMSILADALEDAGCNNADILEHCRGGGPHVRGCWVLDLILGKE